VRRFVRKCGFYFLLFHFAERCFRKRQEVQAPINGSGLSIGYWEFMLDFNYF
jgi:hypothetical protein